MRTSAGRSRSRVKGKYCQPIVAAIEAMEPRRLMTVLVDWTFENTAPASAGPFAPEVLNVASASALGHHASAATYSSPVGNASAHSFSANTWSTGDYYQFQINTAGQELGTFGFDQTGSNTGPKDFKVQYSSDGTNFTDLASYSITNDSWSSGGSPKTASTHSFTLSGAAQAAVSNQSAAYFRVVQTDTTAITGGTVATAGTDRIDNVTISGDAVQVPTIASLTVNPTSVVVNSGTTVTLTANNVQDPSGNSITGVTFYKGTVDPSNIVGTGTSDGSGNWVLSGVSTAGLPTGNTTYLAVATDSGSLTSASVSTTLNVTAAQQVGFNQTSYSVDEAAGTATITVTRSGDTSGSATVNYATSDGAHFADPINTNVDGAAVAGTDYTATSGVLSFGATDTSKSFTVSIADVKTFAGTRTLNLTLTQGTGATILPGGGSATLAITDDQVAGADAPSGVTTFSYNVEPTAGAGTPNSFLPLAFNSHNSFASASMPEIEFGSGSSVFANETASAIDSIKLSLFNTATSGGFKGVPGSFDVYLLTDDTVPATSLTYAAAGDTGPAVLGTPPEAGAELVGTGVFTNNVIGYNDYTFDNLSPAVESALLGYFNHTNSNPIRFVITPSAGNPMSVDWEGNFGSSEQPTLTMLVEKASTSTLPPYITPSAGAQFSWDSSSGNLVLMSGTLTFTQDQATSGDTTDPLVNLSAVGNTSNVVFNTSQHLAGLTLTGGATATVTSLGGSRTHDNHNVLVIGTVDQATAPTFAIDSQSTLDLTDNDMIVHSGNYAAVEAAAATGRNAIDNQPGDGQWNGKGLTSSSAAGTFQTFGEEVTALAVQQNDFNLVNGSFGSWQVGSFNEPLSASGNDVIVKYTYVGDFTLDGQVDGNDAGIIGNTFGLTGIQWGAGDTNGDGVVDGNDAGYFGNVLFGLGTAGSGFDQL